MPEELHEKWKKWEGKVVHIRIGDVDPPYHDAGYITVNFELLDGPQPEMIKSFDVDPDHE
jgi:hypothetical protein